MKGKGKGSGGEGREVEGRKVETDPPSNPGYAPARFCHGLRNTRLLSHVYRLFVRITDKNYQLAY